MASTDARPVPRKNAAFRYSFAIRKNDGTLATSWTGADSEVSIDGAAFADCTNEATEIGTSGVGYIDLTSSEMNGDSVIYKLTVTNSGALPLVVTFFPEEAGDYRADAVMISGDSAAADNAESFFDGTGYAGTNNVIPIVTSVAGLGSGAITAASIASNAITAAKIATDAIGAAQVASDAVTEMQSGLSTLNAAGVRAAVGLSAANLDNQLAVFDTLLDRLPDIAILGTVSGTPTTTTIVGQGGGPLSAANDLYNGMFLVFTSGSLRGIGMEVTDYVGSTRTFTTDAFPATASNGDTFVLVGRKDT